MTHPSQCLQPEPARAKERARVKQQEGLIYQRKQEAEYEKEENHGGWAKKKKKSISVAGRKIKHRKKAATTIIR